MTVPASIIAVSSFKVGAAGTEYACTRFARTVKVLGPAQSSDATMRHEVWTATLHAVAANVAGIAAAWEAIRVALVKRGQRVTIAWHAGLRVLPESGTPAGVEERSIAGYPIVELDEQPDVTYGTWLTFGVRAESMIPVVGEEGLVEHDYTVEESIDDVGLVSITQRGKVRVVNGSSARTWLDTEIIDPAETAATAAGHAFTRKYTQGLDAALIEYSYTAADRTTGGGAGITDARVEDNTTRSREGRLVRRVSGYATGSGAAAYALAQEPAASATLLLVSRQVSEPSIPDDRVSFSYELLSGVEDPAFPDITIFRYDEAITAAGGGRSAVVQAFFDAEPNIRMGVQQPFLYRQRSTIEFIGAWEDHGLTLAFDEGLLAEPVAIDKSGGVAGLRRVSLSAVFISPTEIDPVPDPREVDGLA